MIAQKPSMGRSTVVVPIICAMLAIGGRDLARAAEGPYESGLLRLSEVLGSLHFLRNLCGEKGDQWRGKMEELLAVENPDAARRARLIARFNHGYRSFEGSYSACTPSATEAIRRYMKEGEQLSREISSRYGN
jgi:uncharacterized protein (TIGR02301 family)